MGNTRYPELRLSAPYCSPMGPQHPAMIAKGCPRLPPACTHGEAPAAARSILSVSFQGIQFLIENDLLKSTCEDIAQFLYKGEGLNKTAIGDYLGER